MSYDKWRGSLLQGFRYAFSGLGVALRSRALLGYLLIAVVVAALGLWLRFDGLRWTVLILALTLALFAGVLKIAVDRVMDLAALEDEPRVAVIRNVAAGAILVATLGAVAGGLLALLPPLLEKF